MITAYIIILHNTTVIMGMIIPATNSILSIKLGINFIFLTHPEVSNIFQKTFKFPKHLNIYRQLQIIGTDMNHIINYALPIGQLVLFLCAVISTYLIVKLHNTVTIPLTILCGMILLGILGFIDYVFPLISAITVRSTNLLKSWKVGASPRTTLWTKQVRSCCPIRIRVGSFYYVETKTRTELLASIFYYTASLVISV